MNICFQKFFFSYSNHSFNASNTKIWKKPQSTHLWTGGTELSSSSNKLSTVARSVGLVGLGATGGGPLPPPLLLPMTTLLDTPFTTLGSLPLVAVRGENSFWIFKRQENLDLKMSQYVLLGIYSSKPNKLPLSKNGTRQCKFQPSPTTLLSSFKHTSESWLVVFSFTNYIFYDGRGHTNQSGKIQAPFLMNKYGIPNQCTLYH